MMDADKLLTIQVEPKTHILSIYEKLYTRGKQVEANADARHECL